MIPGSGTVIQVTRNGMRYADPELQLKLIDTYFSLIGRTQVGIAGGMTGIMEAQRQAAKLISI